MNRILLISIVLLSVISPVPAQDLARRAQWEARMSSPSVGNTGATITSIEKSSPLSKAGLQEGDIILSVNDLLINSGERWTTATYAIRADQPVKLLIRRKHEVFEETVRLNPLGRESHDSLDTYYETIVSDAGIKQRMIITKPKGKRGKLPAVFLLQGLSCSTVELHPTRRGNWAKQINSVVEGSGAVVMRVEKPGVGDSDGDCTSTDFLSELEGYRAAIRSLMSKDYVDTSRIVIYGSSMGSALAPLLANEFGLAGVISDGTFFKTWFEHMLEIERRIRKMSGDDEHTITKKMNEAYIPLYYGMLIQKKSYEEILNEYPAIASLNYHSPAHMYERPMAYYQQLQDTDLAGEWEKLKVPVRILYGTNDWIMSEFDNDMIIKVLEQAGHKDHVLVKYPGLDHWNTIHETPEDSFFGRPGKWDQAVPDLINKWIAEMINP